MGTAAFFELAQKDNGGTDKTGEGRMLEASRAELHKTINHDDGPLAKLWHGFLIIVDNYIVEPFFTTLRFLQLVGIFVPVIVAVPAIWFGPRQPDRDDERSGTLWWYGFLVQAMEWAGPAFIKVRQLSFSSPFFFGLGRCLGD